MLFKWYDRIRRVGALALAITTMAVMTLQGWAESPTAFHARAMLPSNQVDSDVTYFDLMVEPDMKQTLQVVVTNSEDREIAAHIALNPASNAQNGLISYSNPDARDESLTLSINEIARIRTPEILLSPGETKLVDIDLELPAGEFDGVVLGGVTVSADYTEELEDEAAGGGFQIENRYAYIIGLKLRETQATVEPEFDLKSITPGLVNYRQAVIVNLQQSEAVIAGGLTVTGKVTKSDDADFIRELNLERAQMAPNSNGDFIIDWEDIIAPGAYRLQMRVDWEDRYWEWDETFVIEADKAQAVNEESVVSYEQPQAKAPIWVYLIIGLLLLVILLLICILWRRREDSKKKPTQAE